MNITIDSIKETLRAIMAEETEYQTFFKKALEKAGKSIPSMSDEEKKAFFNKIDAAWDGKGEKNEELTDKQKQLDIDGDGEIEASDLAALRAGEKVEESHDCGCGCGGVTEGGCSTNISEGKHDKTLDKLADLVKGAKSFMDIGKELKKAKIKDYHFSTSMLPMYVINIGGAKVAILNKKYADGAERIVGTTAIGLMESVNEGMFGLIDQIKQDSKDAKDFVKNIFSDKSFKDMKNDKDFIKYLKSIYEGFKISEELTFEINTFLERPILSKNKITLENSNVKDIINVLVKEGIHKRLSFGVKREFTELLKKHK
jgi:hypothetical protein